MFLNKINKACTKCDVCRQEDTIRDLYMELDDVKTERLALAGMYLQLCKGISPNMTLDDVLESAKIAAAKNQRF